MNPRRMLERHSMSQNSRGTKRRKAWVKKMTNAGRRQVQNWKMPGSRELAPWPAQVSSKSRVDSNR